MPLDLEALARRAREHPGLRAKRALRSVAQVVGGDGDDAALMTLPDLPGALAAGAEAIWPPFVARAPRAAGIAGVVAAVNDLAATGADPLGVLDTITAGDSTTAETILEGLRVGAELYETPLLGGHLTIEAGLAPSVSTMAVGYAERPLSGHHARAGDALCLVSCIEGQSLSGAEGELFFSHLRGPRRGSVASDVRLLAAAAAAGEAWAARDVSMPGVVGSLLQLLESAGGLGCELDVTAIEPPVGLSLAEWIGCFPSFAFLLVGDAAALLARFRGAGLSAGRVGTLDGSGLLRLTDGDRAAEVWDLAATPLTGLGPQSGRAS